MAARCSTRWLLVAVGTPRPPAAAGTGARPPRGGVVGASLGRKLSVIAFTPSLGARGQGALLTLRPGVSLTGEGRFRCPSRGSKAWKGGTHFAPVTGVAGCRVFSEAHAELLGGDGQAGGPSDYSVDEICCMELPAAGVQRPVGRDPSPLCQHLRRPLSCLPRLPRPIPSSPLLLPAGAEGRRSLPIGEHPLCARHFVPLSYFPAATPCKMGIVIPILKNGKLEF